MSHQPRSGFSAADAFDLARLAANFSVSTGGSTGPRSSLSSLTDAGNDNLAFSSNPTAEEWPRRPSKFVQHTFQRSSGASKDDMAMPSRRQRLEPDVVNDTVAAGDNDNDSKRERGGRKKRTPQRKISQDDSYLGNYTHTPLKPRLRPSDRDIKTGSRQYLLEKKSEALQDTSWSDSSDPKQGIVTTKNDLSHSLVAKLGTSAIDQHKNNIAAGRRRASVNVLPGSTHKDTGAAAISIFAATAFQDEEATTSRSMTPIRKGGRQDNNDNNNNSTHRKTRTTGHVKFDQLAKEPPKSQHSRHYRHHGQTEERKVVREHHHTDREESRHKHRAEPSGHRRHSPRRDSGSPPEQSRHTRHRRGSGSPPEQSRHTRHRRGSGSPPEKSRHTRHRRGSSCPPEQSRHTRHRSGSASPPEQSRHTRHRRGSGSPPEKSRHTRHRRDSRSPQDNTAHRRNHHRSDSPSPPRHGERSGHYRPSRRHSHSHSPTDKRQGSHRHLGHSNDRRRRHSAEGHSSHHRRRGGRSGHNRNWPEGEELVDRDASPDDKVIRRKGADVNRSIEEKMLAAGEMNSEVSLQHRKRESVVIPLDVLQKVPPQKARGRESIAIPLDVLQKIQNKSATPSTHDKNSNEKEPTRHKRQTENRNVSDPSGRHGHRSASKSKHKRGAAHKGNSRSKSEDTDHIRTVDLDHESKRAPRRSSSLNQLDTDLALQLDESFSEKGIQRTTKEERHARSKNQAKGEGNQKVSDVFVAIGNTSKVGLTGITNNTRELQVEKDDRSARSRSPRRMPPKLDSVDRPTHKLTMDTGRRRSISPRRQTISPLGFKGLAHQDSGPSRFKEALLKQQASQAPQPTNRYSSSGIEKLEVKSRRSLFVTSNSERDVMVKDVPQYLKRSRMGFLDESVSFSDSEEESGDEDVVDGDEGDKDSKHDNVEVFTQEDAVKSVKKKMRDSYFRMSRSEGDLLQTFDLEKEIAREKKKKKKKQRENRRKGNGNSAHKRTAVPTKRNKRGSTEHKCASASQHDNRLCSDLDHVDLTALRPSQVQAVLKRAMQENNP